MNNRVPALLEFRAQQECFTQIKCYFLGKVDLKSRFVQIVKSKALGGWGGGGGR